MSNIKLNHLKNLQSYKKEKKDLYGTLANSIIVIFL